MGLLATLLGAAPKSEWGGLHLEEAGAWEVEPTRDQPTFLRALPKLLPDGSRLYFEGTTEREVEHFLSARTVLDPEKIAIGTVWPRPKRYHVPYSEDLVHALAELLEKTSISYLCTHVHAYIRGKVLLEWHDAFDSDPVRISRSLDEAAVSAFAAALRTGYSRSGV
jgi:hypothetical protein